MAVDLVRSKFVGPEVAREGDRTLCIRRGNLTNFRGKIDIQVDVEGLVPAAVQDWQKLAEGGM